MDLNPVEVKDIYDYQISENIEVLDANRHKFISNKFYCENLYEETKIGQLVQIIRDKTLNRLILEALIYVENNDHCKLTAVVHNLKEIRFSNNITVEEAELLLTIFDKYFKKNFYDFNYLNNVISLMMDLVSIKNIHIKLDWRVYYIMFVQFYGLAKKEFAWNYTEIFLQKISLTDFIKKARKFFQFTKEDYDHLKAEISQRLTTIDGQITFGLLLAQLFLPEEYFKDDVELQNKFMDILENQSKHANYVLLNFCKIVKYGIKVEKTRFIENFFSLLFCLLSDGMSLSYFYWPDAVAKDRHCTISVCYIMAMLLIKSDFEGHREIILKKFNIILNLLSADLTENNCSTFTFDFVKLFLRNVKFLGCHVNDYEISGYDTYGEFIVLDEYRDNISNVIKMLKPIISKCFLYNDSSTYSLFLEYVALTDISLIYSEFNDIITHLYEHSFNDYNFFIKKITIFIRCFFVNLDNRETFKFLITIIETSVDKISCANEALNRNIIDFFNVLYTILLGLKEKINSENSEMRLNSSTNLLVLFNTTFLIKKINEVTILIVKKILRLISFFSSIIKEMQLELFLYHMDKIITIQTRREICQIISNHLKNNTIKENSEFQVLNHFVTNLKQDSDEQCRLGKYLWSFCYTTLTEFESENLSCMNGINSSTPSLKLRENSKDQFTYIKNIIINCINYTDMNEEGFLTLIKLLLNDKQDKKKLAYQMLKYLCYNSLLPIFKKNKIIYPSAEKILLIKNVYYVIISPYEQKLHHKFETVKKIIDSNSNIKEREKLLQICKKDFEELDEIMTIYLRLTYGFMHECNNIFMRDLSSFESELKEIISTISEIEIYNQLKSLREKIRTNVQNFYQMSKKLKILKKSEKYFRRSFSAKVLDLDRFYHIKLISNYRKYLVLYRELQFGEIHFIYKNLSLSSMYSHLKLFKLQEKPDLNLIAEIFKFYIKSEDKKLIESPVFKIAYMIQNVPADSTEAYEFFERIISLIDKAFKKIPIGKEIILNDVKKFERIIDILYGFVENYLNKTSDMTMILKSLNKFRMLIDKFKFKTSDELEYLIVLTDLANHMLAKPVTFFKIKTSQAFSANVSNLSLDYDNVLLEKMIFTNAESILKNESLCHIKNLKNRLNVRQYLNDNLENQFPSENRQDSLELMIDFLTTIKLSLDVFDEEDRKILNMAEKIYWRNFIDEKEMLKKQVFYTAIGTILYLKFKFIKSMNLKEVNVENSFSTSSDILMTQKKNFEPMKKKYTKVGRETLNFEANECYEKELNTAENLKNFFLNFYNFQDQTEYLNLIETNSNTSEIGIHDTITGRLRYLFNPHLNGSILVSVKTQYVASLTETPSLFSYNKANILSFIFLFSNVTEYEEVFKIFEDLLSSKQYDQIVLTNCLVMFLFAIVKRIRLTGNYLQINQIMNKVMKYYTNRFNKRIDSEIFGFITSVIRMCTPEEIIKIFIHFGINHKLENNISGENIEIETAQTESSLLFFNYDDSFLFKSIGLLFSKLNYRIYLIFNHYTLQKLQKIFDNFLTDKIKWKKYSLEFDKFYNILLFIKRIITFDHKDNYIHSYSEDIEEEIQKMLDLFNKDQSKESLRLLNIIYKESIGYLIQKPSLMVSITSKFVAFIRLDHKNFKKFFDIISSLIYKLFFPKNIDVLEYVSLFKTLIESCVTPDSVKFYVNLIRKLMVPRLNLIINHEVECFQEFSQIVNVLKTNECKKYFCHLILSYVINLFDSKTSHSIILSLIEKIHEEKTNSVCLTKNKPVASIVTMLTSFLMKYELYINTSTELVILKFKELNNKVFKNNGDASKIIRKCMAEFYNRYSYTFEFANKNVSPECGIAIKELSKSHSYFI